MLIKKMLQAVAVAAVVVVLGVGCFSSRSSLVLEPVGPDSPGRGVATSGQLIVYTATAPYNSGDIYYYPHTGYVVFDVNGKKVKYVENRIGQTDQAPMLLTLPAGQYTIEAQSEAYGRVRVPVVIEGGRLTRVYLERQGMPKAEVEKQKNLVVFPNGVPIGVRAQTSVKAQP